LAKQYRHLSKDATAQVQTEIQEHYESAREAAISDSSTLKKPLDLLLAALGDERAANRRIAGCY
jgi:hypothetical protein